MLRHLFRNSVLTAFGLCVTVALAGGAGQAVAQSSGLQSFSKGGLEIVTADKTHKFSVEIARTPGQQAQGLMFRRRLAADAGMIFLYGEPRIITMWMKNTYIPLDMIFIGKGGRIVSIAQRTIPQSLATVSSELPASAVLEVNAGTASRLGIQVGDRINHAAIGAGG